jgi:hypothetical protein
MTKRSDQQPVQVVVANSLISYFWAGAGTTAAPDASNLPDFVIGVNNGGVASANVYHVIGGAWVDTGSLVSHLYGA